MKVTGCKKIYNAENIMEAEMLVEMLKENVQNKKIIEHVLWFISKELICPKEVIKFQLSLLYHIK